MCERVSVFLQSFEVECKEPELSEDRESGRKSKKAKADRRPRTVMVMGWVLWWFGGLLWGLKMFTNGPRTSDSVFFTSVVRQRHMLPKPELEASNRPRARSELARGHDHMKALSF